MYHSHSFKQLKYIGGVILIYEDVVERMLLLELASLFLIGYMGIVFEGFLKINKSAVALIMGGMMWLFCFFHLGHGSSGEMALELADTAQVIFFLFAAMAIIELIDAHKGFELLVRCFRFSSGYSLLWLLIGISFFMSAALDNLTSIIIIVSILKRLVKNREDRWILGAVCVIAVNAGGAWTPLGDVTTTMLWINNKVSSWGIIKSLFFPSAICALVSGLVAQLFLKKRHIAMHDNVSKSDPQPGAYVILILGIGSLLMVPVWKTCVGLPPFMGGLLGLGLVWLASDWLHHPHGESRSHLRVPYILTKIDISSITFFIGILMAVNALTYGKILFSFSEFLDRLLPSRNYVAVVIGLVSSILDNVPLVAATIGMYDLPTDHTLWKLIAYAAGTGGSILVIGSAAGVAYMGIEKVDFLWYFKKISLVAILGYFGGLVTYFVLNGVLGL
ncbi:MAG: NhaD family Na+:H+ antiporter [Victivallaceae bacterium]